MTDMQIAAWLRWEAGDYLSHLSILQAQCERGCSFALLSFRLDVNSNCKLCQHIIGIKDVHLWISHPPMQLMLTG